ncbi:DUF1010 domain-containing protein [Acidovorax sp. HDW3]
MTVFLASGPCVASANSYQF